MPIVTKADLEASLGELRGEVQDPAHGILGPGSTTWRIAADLALFLGGGRAALLQLAHPMVAYALDHHSRTRSDVTGRFQRTFQNVFAMLYGDLEEAFHAARRVHAIHSRIHGTMTEHVGGWVAGSSYQANDVDALYWVHATLVDTTILIRELVDGTQPDAVKDAYVMEMQRFARLFGIPRSRLAANWLEHRSYMSGMLAGNRIAVAPCAREMARFLVGRGQARQTVLGRGLEMVTHLMMPSHLAEQFELRGSPRQARATLIAFATTYRRIPRRLMAIPAYIDARNRLAGRGRSQLAAWTQRQLFGLARKTTGGSVTAS